MSTGLRFATAKLATGPRVHCVEHGPAEGPATIFLHGWPDSWFSWSRVLPLLPTGLRAIAFDQRGFGESERPAGEYAIENFADDVAALLDVLAIERANIVGHSFGSFVARRVAIAHRERVKRLALIGTAVSARNAVTTEVETLVRGLTDPVPVEFVREFQAGTAYLPLPAPFFEQIVTESLKMPALQWRLTFEGVLAYNEDASLGRIEAETLLLWGDRDALFPREDQGRLAAAIPHARLTVYAETGHCPNWERPERVAADLGAFLEPS